MGLNGFKSKWMQHSHHSIGIAEVAQSSPQAQHSDQHKDQVHLSRNHQGELQHHGDSDLMWVKVKRTEQEYHHYHCLPEPIYYFNCVYSTIYRFVKVTFHSFIIIWIFILNILKFTNFYHTFTSNICSVNRNDVNASFVCIMSTNGSLKHTV